MATPFIRFQEPSPEISQYSWQRPRAQQDPRVPATFLDAMDIRTEVFVKGQSIAAEAEFDSDDARSCHFVAYASVSEKQTAPEVSEGHVAAAHLNSVHGSLPFATVRLVPFPHQRHPDMGSHYSLAGALSPSNSSSEYAIKDRVTSFHDGIEPYIKLGRLGVLPEFRRFKQGSRMVVEALDWLVNNPTHFNPSIYEIGLEKMGVSAANDIPYWKGLVCIHAQEHLIKFYEGCGFELDPLMGSWYEEGLKHVGMWRRLEFVDLQNNGPRARTSSSFDSVGVPGDKLQSKIDAVVVDTSFKSPGESDLSTF